MTANFMLMLTRPWGCALLRVVIVHDKTRMNDPWYPAKQRQNEAEEETGDAPSHKYRERRKNHAKKISQRFHRELFL